VVLTYGWTILLGEQGPLNYVLQKLHLIDAPLKLVYNTTGVIISLVHIFLPFVVFPIYTSLNRIDPSLKEAAQDLGGGWFVTFWRVTLPLSLTGVVSAAEVCYTLSLGAFVVPAMLGGGRVQTLSLTIYNDTSAINWPIAAVGGMVLLLLALVAVGIFNRLLRHSEVS
jgi:putative spermidine/putrescine transport system permease protein